MRHASAEAEIPGAALGVESPGDRDRLHQGRFAAAVLTYQEGHGGMQLQRVELADDRQGEWIAVEGVDFVPAEFYRQHIVLGHERLHVLSLPDWRMSVIGSCPSF